MDAIRTWIDTCCVVAPEKKGQALMLYRSYYTWADANGEHIMPQRAFLRRLEERSFQRKQTKTGYVYFGIGLRGNKL
jgi:phage/plasmid-associated DNA primase